MAFNYPIKPNSFDSHQSTPYWLAAVVPFAVKDSYNHDVTNPSSNIIASNNPVAEVGANTNSFGDLILIDDDCVNWNTMAAKESHVNSLQLSLKQRAISYIKNLAPGDWILFWAFNDYATYLKTKQLIINKKRANHFNNAPKFIGRITSIFKDKIIDSSTGRPQLNYTILSHGFSELDAHMYYNTEIGFKYPNAFSKGRDFSSEINSFLTQDAFVRPHEAIQALIGLCLGLGPGVKWKAILDVNDPSVKANTPPEILQSVGEIILSPNESYLIPATVAQLLNGQVKSINTYADLIRCLVGLQQYRSPNTNGQSQTDFKAIINGFIPETSKMTGQFQPQSLDFNDTPVWSILQTYLNPPMNEMYSSLRVDSTGYVMPTVIARQVPFSSNKFFQGLDRTKNNATPFTSLPRWNIDKGIIQSIRVGYSNAMRKNYVQIVGAQLTNPNPSGAQLAREYNNQYPILDKADIQRSGLQTFIVTTNSYYNNYSNTDLDDKLFWSKLMADKLFGAHLKLSGTIILKGVQEPICVGDNCVVDGIIYHIESVSHYGTLDFNGHKDFTTTLQVSNGISINSDQSTDIVYAFQSESNDDTDIGVDFEVK